MVELLRCGPGLEWLARYIVRPPVSLERMPWDGGGEEVAYTLKPKSGEPGGEEHLDPLGFLARVIAHVPEPKLHTIHYYGHYSNVARGRRRKRCDVELRGDAQPRSLDEEPDGLTPAERLARRRAWARLIRRVYEVDTLVCARCGGGMRVISVILDPAVIRTILDHIRNSRCESLKGVRGV